MPSKNVYDDYTVAGQEVSSTYEGRHIQIEESILYHPVHSPDYVHKGDPVSVGGSDIVGVAFNTADAATDYIAIDTEGIWALSVVGKDDEGGSAVVIGDVIYINRANGELSKITSDTTHAVFGYALNEVVSGQTTVIAVKVHWDQWFDVYRDYTGTGNEDGFVVDINDACTGTDGINTGIKIKYDNDADKTGTHEINGIGIDMNTVQNVPYEYGISLYHSESGNPTIGFLASLCIYQDALGTAVANAVGIDIGLAWGTNSPSGRHAFMRMRNHSAGATPDCAFQFEGTGNADYFASWETVSVPIVAAAIGGNQTHKIAVRVANVNYFIPLYTA